MVIHLHRHFFVPNNQIPQIKLHVKNINTFHYFLDIFEVILPLTYWWLMGLQHKQTINLYSITRQFSQLVGSSHFLYREDNTDTGFGFHFKTIRYGSKL